MASTTTPAPSEPSSPFQDYLNTLHDPASNLQTTIQAIHDLIPHLKPSISPTGTRLVSFSNTNTNNYSKVDLSGTAKLDTLGSTYLSSARRCTRERAPFKTRLQHISLDDSMEELYGKSQDLLQAGLKDGSVKFPPQDPNEVEMCACCRGDPDATILSGFHYNNALFYEEEEYKRIWGDEENCGSMYGSDLSWFMASKKQVERMAKVAEGEGVGSKL
ncbi:uncharacterized protein BDV17DRAFT_291171 [Aspergillus undulatus]|uniref:uncharacterized protein n=1 Tax=Aspergillus undulatus TaxID=1810928 RepID=UPI003CCCE104